MDDETLAAGIPRGTDNDTRNAIMVLPEHLSYAGVLLALLATGLGVPIPEELVVLVAGYLCHHGQADLLFMFPVAFIGVLASDFMWFGMGWRFGDHLLEHRFTRRVFRRRTLESMIERYHRHGAKIIFAGRFLPGMRSMILTTAGVVGIPWWKLAIVDGGAALISVPTLMMLGWFFGEKSAEMFAHVRHAQHYVTAVVVLIVVVGVGVEWYRNRRARRKSAVEARSAGEQPAESRASEVEPDSGEPIRRSGPVSPRQPTTVE